MLLQPFDIAVDYSSARPDPALMAQLGVKMVSRYICQINEATRPKLLTIPERDRLFDHGIGIQPNFEWYAHRTNEGARAGAEDGRVIGDMLAVLDWPESFFVCVSADTDQTPGTYQATADYFAALREVVGRPVSAYIDADGGKYLLDRGLIDHPGIWAPAASGWNSIAPHTVYLQQWVGFPHAELQVLGRVDDNTVVAPFEVWAGENVTGEGSNPSPQRKDDMLRILHPDGRQFVCVGRGLEPIEGPAAQFIELKDGPPLTCRPGTDDLAALEQWIGQSAAYKAQEDAALDARIRAIVADEISKYGGNGVSIAAIRSSVRAELDATSITGHLGK